MPNTPVRNNIKLLESLIEYDPETGVALWKPRSIDMFKSGMPKDMATWNSRYAGKPCGRVSGGGYISTVIFGHRIMVHRAVWQIHHKELIPAGAQIDHINGDPGDNRASNLRVSMPHQNQANRASKSFMRGAAYHKTTGKWQASIRLHLGTFDSEEEAAAAYEDAAKKLHGEFYLPNGKRANASRVL